MIPYIRRLGKFRLFFLSFTSIIFPLFVLAFFLGLTNQRKILFNKEAEYLPVVSANEEYPLNIPKQIYNFSIDADITLDNDTGFIRVIGSMSIPFVHLA